MSNKNELRKHFKSLALEIPTSRKEEVSSTASLILPEHIKSSGLVGSYSALSVEVDLYLFNQSLAQAGRLCLPKIEGNKIKYYLVNDLEKELLQSDKGVLEPLPLLTQEIDAAEISSFFIPGLSFDSQGYRLGWGGGYFDRFLSDYPGLNTFGILYKEQLSKTSLSLEEHDQKVKKVLAF